MKSRKKFQLHNVVSTRILFTATPLPRPIGSRACLPSWIMQFLSIEFMCLYIFEEFLIIKGGWAVYGKVFSSVVIRWYAIMSPSKINWLFSEVVILYTKIMLHFFVGWIMGTTGIYPCIGWGVTLYICIMVSSREYYWCNSTILVS